jgi:hypothetical protein
VNNVQNNKLTKGAFAALLLASAVANADTQYPAADFQPSVVFQDEAYISNTQTAAKAAAPAVKTPAAPAHVAAPASDESDAKYPAASFQPVVVFSDPNYKHNSVVSKQSKSTPIVTATQEDAAIEEAAPAVKKTDDSSSYLIGLIGLAVAGFFLFRGQGTCPSARKENDTTPTHAPVATGLTGVARYLNKKAGTGVTRYLERQSKTATTGVARYVARQVVAKAKKETTGVEKYVRDRG